MRSVVGECLHNIQILGGAIVSVTTDGFITNIENLEEKIYSDNRLKKCCLLKIYSQLRKNLAFRDPKLVVDALEIKYKGVGIIS